MSQEFYQDQTFTKIDYTQQAFPKGEYDNCTFVNCKFEAVYLSTITFLECTFDTCDMTNTKVKSTSFNEVNFVNCKLLGVDFSVCNHFLFSVTFKACNLELASFAELNMKQTNFSKSNLQKVDFTATNLESAVFDDCDLKAAIFEQTNLEKADFISARNYSIDPIQNRLKKAQFSRKEIHGLLTNYDIKISS
ncbi:MAG: pentapeptide repeat-containing protein [Kordia sp.]|uniref:pentapeptide repeat-containing protein n=1 Tax=Kordia sp. TaxID=1965332 RepID=UPI003858D3B0